MDGPRRDLPALLSLGLLAALAFWNLNLLSPSLPTDEAFASLQQAQRASHLRPFEFVPDRGFQSGLAGPLWPLVLAPGHWAGFEGTWLVLWAWTLLALLWLATLAMVHGLAATMDGRGAGLTAALLLLANGRVAASVWRGTESALFSAGMLLAVYGLHRWASRTSEKRAPGPWPWLAWAATAALGLTRPEGLALAAVAALVVTWRANRGLTGLLQALGWWVSLAPGLALLGLNHAATGSWAANAQMADSLLTDPFASAGETLAAFAGHWVALWSPDGAGGALLLAFALVGASAGLMAQVQRGHGDGVTLAALWTIAGAAWACTETAPGVGFDAHLPLVILLATLGIGETARLWRTRAAPVQALLGVALVLLTAPSLLTWGHEHSERLHDLRERSGRMAGWLADRRSVPPETRVGMTEPGLLTLLNPDLRISDLTGRMTTRLAAPLARQASAWRQGPGTLWESLERAENRPEIIITGEAERLGAWLGQAVMETRGRARGALSAHRPDWSIAHTGEVPSRRLVELPGLRDAPPAEGPATMIVDSVDVADLMSEGEHGHRWWEASPPWTQVRGQTRAGEATGEVIWDGGRLLTGGESFRVVVEPQRPLRLIGRSDGAAAVRLAIRVGEGTERPIDVPAGAGWVEFHLDFPPAEVPAPEVEVQVRVEQPPRGGAVLRSHHWWAVQGV